MGPPIAQSSPRASGQESQNDGPFAPTWPAFARRPAAGDARRRLIGGRSRFVRNCAHKWSKGLLTGSNRIQARSSQPGGTRRNSYKDYVRSLRDRTLREDEEQDGGQRRGKPAAALPRGCPVQTVGNRPPFGHVGQRFHDDQFRSGLVALMELAVQRASKGLRIVGDDRHASKTFARWHAGM